MNKMWTGKMVKMDRLVDAESAENIPLHGNRHKPLKPYVLYM